MLHIDARRRVDFVVSYLTNLEKERVVAVVLPLLSLNPGAALVSSLAMTAYRFYHEKDVKNSDKALFIGTTALTIFCPRAQMLITGALAACTYGKQFYDGKNRASSLFHLTDQIVHLSSVYTNSPLLIMASLVLQAAKEVYTAYTMANLPKGARYPEMCTQLILAAVRLHKAHAYLNVLMPPQAVVPIATASQPKTVSVNKTAAQSLKSLTTTDAKALCEQISQSSSFVDFTELLQKNGFSLQIADVDFSERDFTNARLHDISFTNCVFRKTGFYRVRFDNVTFNRCTLPQSRWDLSHLKNISFANCNLSDAVFYHALVNNVSWHASLLDRASFYHSYLQEPIFHDCSLQETSFLLTSLIGRGSLANCNLTNALLLDAKQLFTITGGTPHTMTKPVVALGWFFGQRPGRLTPSILTALRENGAIVLQYEQETLSPREGILPSLLVQDVQIGMQAVPAGASIAAHLISNPNLPEIAKVRHLAQIILRHSQGLVLPGGNNIPAYFYNPFRLQGLHNSYALQRDALELALLYEAERRKIPTMGICRGAQMINVFFGGTLRTLENNEGWSFNPLTWTGSPHGDPLRNRLGPDFSGRSMHYQAADRLGKTLHVVLEDKGIPKLLISDDGNFLACQFHPELYTEWLGEIAKQLKLSPDQIPLNGGNLMESLMQTITTLSAQADPFIQSLCNHAFKTLKDLEINLRAIAPNREIYRFFIEQLRTEQDSNLSAPA